MDIQQQVPTQEPNEEPLENLATPETLDQAAVQELIDRNAKLYARAKKAEEEKKSYRERLASLEQQAPKPQQEPAPKTEGADEIETVLSLRAKGYSDSEILTLRRYSKRMGVTIAEIEEDPFIKAGISSERERAKAEQATPEPSSSSSLKVGDKPIYELSDKELSANYQDIARKAVEAGKTKKMQGR